MLVVTKGPVATAGSISSFRKISGVNDPTATAINIEHKTLNPMTSPNIGSVSMNLKFANIPNITP